MRRLARELGVEAMSLYHYVTSKDDLLAAIVDHVMSEVALPSGNGDWKADIRRAAISHHQALARHPWASGAITSPPRVGPAQLRYMDYLLRRLREAGFSPEVVHHAYHALDSHIVGSTLWAAGIASIKEDLADLGRAILREIPADDYPDFAEHVRQHITGSMHSEKGTFEFGLDLILDGLERMRGHTPSGAVRRRQTGRAGRRPHRRKRGRADEGGGTAHR
jgi:AcrR family transcriptional regulator